MKFNKQFITNILSDVTIIRDGFLSEPSFSVDSRTLQKGDIFVALSGDNCDGHEFVNDALRKGAAGVIIQKNNKSVLDACDVELLKKCCVLVVPHVFDTFIALARAWRAQFSYPVFAITGSLGKTSTKEYVAHILREHDMPFVASKGNQNTLLGVALNIFRMRDIHQVAIFEVGVSKRGEMVHIADLLRPTNALVTCIGHQHMDGIGSLHDIAHEKRAIFTFFDEKNIGIVNGDQVSLASVSYPHPMVKFGSKTTNQIQARKIQSRGESLHFILKIYKKKYPVSLHYAHEGSIFNVLAATSIAYLLNVPDDCIVRAIQKPLRVAGRFEPCTLKGNKGILINDCYNANPESVKSALIAMQNIKTSAKKVVVLGDMLGLGHNTAFWHRQIGRFLRKVSSLDSLILVGNDIKWVKRTAPVGLSVEIVPTWKEGVTVLEKKLKDNAVVLVKGSQDIGLTHLVHTFVQSEDGL